MNRKSRLQSCRTIISNFLLDVLRWNFYNSFTPSVWNYNCHDVCKEEFKEKERFMFGVMWDTAVQFTSSVLPRAEDWTTRTINNFYNVLGRIQIAIVLQQIETMQAFLMRFTSTADVICHSSCSIFSHRPSCHSCLGHLSFSMLGVKCDGRNSWNWIMEALRTSHVVLCLPGWQ